MKRISTALLTVVLVVPAFAQMDHANCPMKNQKSGDYGDRVTLKVKSLRNEDVEQYRKGTGMGLAIPAELNGYPGPRHVLDLAADLGLTDDQKTKLQAIYDRMHRDAVRLGEEIITLETALDGGFASGSMDDARLAKLTADIASRQGQLRYTHLQAHLEAKALMTRAQIAAYNKARGY